MLKDHVNICSFDGCELYIENKIIHDFIMLHVALIMHVTRYGIKWYICISYALGHRAKSGVWAW